MYAGTGVSEYSGIEESLQQREYIPSDVGDMVICKMDSGGLITIAIVIPATVANVQKK